MELAPGTLDVGTAEGVVHAVLDMGLYRFCSSLPPDGVDGSNGKKFKGKNAAIVECPPSRFLGGGERWSGPEGGAEAALLGSPAFSTVVGLGFTPVSAPHC